MKKLVAMVVLVGVQCIALAPAFAQQNSGEGRRARTARQAPASRPGQQPVRSVSHEVIHEGVILEDDYIADSMQASNFGAAGCDSCGGGGCSTCDTGGGLCRTCHTPPRFCICFPAHGWVQAEYLGWVQSGSRVPPLVTTSVPGTLRQSAGVLGQTGTSILYGNDEHFDGETSGYRIRFGWWLSTFPGWGIEGESVGLGEQTESFFLQSTGAAGSQILARPFFNVLTGQEASELVAFPNTVGGSVAIDQSSEIHGGAVRLRRQMCCSSGSAYSPLCCEMVPTSTRIDATLGYRIWEMKEALQIQENLTSRLSTDPGSFLITDQFMTRNQFNGTEIGVVWQGRRGWWSLDALMRLGIGNVKQTVTIGGSSVITQGNPGTSTTYGSGFLAQSTNIGTFDRNTFTMIPELGLTLGYQLTKRLRLTTGYSLVYWGNVVRPGDQIDLNVNPNLLAPQETTVTTPNRPQFRFVETDYYVQGLSFGGEFRW